MLVPSPYIQRFKAPQFACAVGPEWAHQVWVGSLEEGAALQLAVQLDDQQHIQRACFKAYGCPAVIAAADYACEWAQGIPLNDVDSLSAVQLSTELGLPPAKFHAAVMAVQALQHLLAGHVQPSSSD